MSESSQQLSMTLIDAGVASVPCQQATDARILLARASIADAEEKARQLKAGFQLAMKYLYLARQRNYFQDGTTAVPLSRAIRRLELLLDNIVGVEDIIEEAEVLTSSRPLSVTATGELSSDVLALLEAPGGLVGQLWAFWQLVQDGDVLLDCTCGGWGPKHRENCAVFWADGWLQTVLVAAVARVSPEATIPPNDKLGSVDTAKTKLRIAWAERRRTYAVSERAKHDLLSALESSGMDRPDAMRELEAFVLKLDGATKVWG